MESKTQGEGASVCAIGVFDGVHLGHQALLAALTEDARLYGAKPFVLTFDRDPDELFRPEKVHKLLSNKDRLCFLKEFVDEVLALPFTPELAALSYQAFLEHLLELLPKLKAIHVGKNFHFGAQAKGSVSEIVAWGKKYDIKVRGHALYPKDGVPVSASRIRALLAEGDVRSAAALLTRPHAITGRVVQGAGRGTGLGFATANVEVEGSFAKLGPFVYAAYAKLGDKRYKAAVSIGSSPTFSPEFQRFDPFLFEAHLIDFEGSLYGKELTLEFVERLRPMQCFDCQEELISAVMHNIAWVKDNL